MINKYNISDLNNSVHINMKPYTGQLKAFIDIYVDEEDNSSPFKTVEDAKLFAEIIVKLLNTIGDNCDIER